ncbi:MAG: ATP-binding protein [Clostridia bacterium]|nr:ATP-binding protein [Clostridia bacterium]
MAYNETVVRAARERLEKRRREAESAATALQNKMCEQYPRLKEIQREKAASIPELTRAILDNNPAAAEDIRTRNLQLQEEMASILRTAGCNCDNFEPRYTCHKCGDTGFVGGAVCDCYRRLLQEEACRNLSSLSAMRLTDFASMRLDYYDDAVDPKLGESPRQHMSDIINYCREYTACFSLTNDSLLLTGATGIGKTHLCLAIARGVAEQGYGVVYGSVQPLIRQMEAEHFGRAQGDSEDQLVGCDLLVLDDLGMEFDTPFSRACLYNVLNARLLEGKPTVISTNLSYTALEERYGDQIASRISGGFMPLYCVGRDIRQIIRHQSMG